MIKLSQSLREDITKLQKDKRDMSNERREQQKTIVSIQNELERLKQENKNLLFDKETKDPKMIAL